MWEVNGRQIVDGRKMDCHGARVVVDRPTWVVQMDAGGLKRMVATEHRKGQIPDVRVGPKDLAGCLAVEK